MSGREHSLQTEHAVALLRAGWTLCVERRGAAGERWWFVENDEEIYAVVARRSLVQAKAQLSAQSATLQSYRVAA